MTPSAPIFSLALPLPFLPREEVFEAKTVEELREALQSAGAPKVLILNLQQTARWPELLEGLSEDHPDCPWILHAENPTEEGKKRIYSFPQFHGFLETPAPKAKVTIALALEKVSEAIQEEDLLRLLKNTHAKLKTAPPPERKKHKSSITKAHLRMKTLEVALIEILKARTLREVEAALQKSLAKVFPLDYARILFDQQSSLMVDAKNPLILRLPLQALHSKAKGWLVLGLNRRKIMNEKDHELLEEISEITTLSIHRILQLEASETLKQQWDATFDAISDPLCLVDEGMKILRTNKAFSKTVGKSFSDLLGGNSLEIFFRDNPEVWKTPPPFNLKIQVQSKRDGKSYSLVIHDLRFHIDKKHIYLLLIKDVTDQMRLEKQIREKSKLVELGTIGSSIAHELNNPLAGMLSYLQLLLMDVTEGELHVDLKEMEAATLKCRDIVQSLLGFSRKQSQGEKTRVDLNELVPKAVQLVELKSRFKKVTVRFQPFPHTAFVHGDPNSLVQALTHILSNSVEALEERPAQEKNFSAEVNVSLTENHETFVLRVSDNGPGILEKHLPLVINPLFTTKTGTEHAGLGLTVAYAIFSEHDGSLEIESRPGQGVTAIISLPRPEFAGSSRGIDTQI